MPEMRDRIDRLHVAAPCPMSWEQMRGDDRTRFCESCNLHVYNISELTRKQVGALIASTEGRFCARLYRRADGTVLTKDCPVGLRALRRRASKVAGAAVTALFSLCVSVMGQQASQTDEQSASGGEVKLERINRQTQEGHSMILGVLKDPNGAVVDGASVALINSVTKQTHETTSNDEGIFKFSSVEAGSYDIEVIAPGFAKLVWGHVTVKAGEDIDVGLALQVDDKAYVMLGVVGEEDPLIDTNSLGNATRFGPKKITSLPF